MTLNVILGSCCDGCTVFGTSLSEPLKNFGRTKLLLNFQSPSQCNGIVTGWNFCFYRMRKIIIEDYISLTSIFSVYRRQFASNNIYYEVPNSRKQVIISRKNFEKFSCLKHTLTDKEYFQIQENDIIAVCVPPNKYLVSLLVPPSC